jgi:hypothetical protein
VGDSGLGTGWRERADQRFPFVHLDRDGTLTIIVAVE